jgi:hypothetical protein
VVFLWVMNIHVLWVTTTYGTFQGTSPTSGMVTVFVEEPKTYKGSQESESRRNDRQDLQDCSRGQRPEVRGQRKIRV